MKKLLVASFLVLGFAGHSDLASTPTYVQTCHDPGLHWCGDNTFSLERYAPDGHYREDGSIPNQNTVNVR